MGGTLYRRARMALALPALGLLCGCLTAPLAPDGEILPADAGTVSSRWQPSVPPPAPTGPEVVPARAQIPMPPPPAYTPAPPRFPPPNEQIALLSEQLAATESERRALAARVHSLEGELEQRDKALAFAAQEVREATSQLSKARTELQAWRKDVLALHDRLRASEKENKATLALVVKALEQVLDRDAGRPADPLPPLPKAP